MFVKSDDECDIIINDGYVFGDIGCWICDGGECCIVIVSDMGDSRVRVRIIRDKVRVRRR